MNISIYTIYIVYYIICLSCIYINKFKWIFWIFLLTDLLNLTRYFLIIQYVRTATCTPLSQPILSHINHSIAHRNTHTFVGLYIVSGMFVILENCKMILIYLD